MIEIYGPARCHIPYTSYEGKPSAIDRLSHLFSSACRVRVLYSVRSRAKVIVSGWPRGRKHGRPASAPLTSYVALFCVKISAVRLGAKSFNGISRTPSWSPSAGHHDCTVWLTTPRCRSYDSDNLKDRGEVCQRENETRREAVMQSARLATSMITTAPRYFRMLIPGFDHSCTQELSVSAEQTTHEAWESVNENLARRVRRLGHVRFLGQDSIRP